MILDTTYFLDLKRQDPAAFEKGLELRDSSVPIRVPTHVFFELLYGVGVTQGKEEQRRVENVLMGYPPAAADERVGRLAGRLLGRLEADAKASGESSGADIGDAYVAATARLLDERVLTRNVDDFEALGVEVETY
jgi:predicted nucleic acid-binding protein